MLPDSFEKNARNGTKSKKNTFSPWRHFSTVVENRERQKFQGHLNVAKIIEHYGVDAKMDLIQSRLLSEPPHEDFQQT